jgi:hypothetical protein
MNHSGSYNDYGRCVDSDVMYTREADQNAIGDTFRMLASNFPIVGNFIAGMVPPTYTANAVRLCPGATIDHTTNYYQEYTLMAIVFALVVIYLMIRK